MTAEMLSYLDASQEELKQLIRDLCAIPAPSHHEEKRAQFCKKWFESIGAKGVFIDEALNVVCPHHVSEDGPVTVFMAHTDTVFPDTEPMPFIETEEHLALLSDLDAVTFSNVNGTLEDLQNPTVAWVGKTLVLDSNVSMKYVVNLSEFQGDLSELNLHISYMDIEGNPKSAIVTELEAYSADKGWYAFTFDGLLAAELRCALSAQVFAGSTPVSVTLRYSPDTYGNGQTAALGHLCKALFAYSDSARAFFTK